MMIVLKKGKFISGLKIFKAGDILPDTVDAQELVRKNIVEIIQDTPKKAAKTNKKAEAQTVQNVENAE